MNRPEIIEKIKNLLQKSDPTVEVIVYGSEVKGDARENHSFLTSFYLKMKERIRL